MIWSDSPSLGRSTRALQPHGQTVANNFRASIEPPGDRSRVEALLGSAGFDLVDWFTDEDNLFALSLARRARS